VYRYTVLFYQELYEQAVVFKSDIIVDFDPSYNIKLLFLCPVPEICCASNISCSSIPLSVPFSDHLLVVRLPNQVPQKVVRGRYRQGIEEHDNAARTTRCSWVITEEIKGKVVVGWLLLYYSRSNDYTGVVDRPSRIRIGALHVVFIFLTWALCVSCTGTCINWRRDIKWSLQGYPKTPKPGFSVPI